MNPIHAWVILSNLSIFLLGRESIHFEKARLNRSHDSKRFQLYTAQGAPIDLNNVDVEVVNGFIHVIDAVMLPPEMTVWELVESSDDFTTLQVAIETAGLEETLNGTLSNKTRFFGKMEIIRHKSYV